MTTPFPFVSGATLLASQLNSITQLPSRTLTSSGTAVTADNYSRVILNGTAVTYTINTGTFDTADVVQIYNANSAVATIAAGAGITLNGAAGLTLAQYQTAELYAISPTSFVLSKSEITNKILQVVSTAKTDTFTTTSTSFTDVTGLSVSITPSATSSTILVLATITGSNQVGTNDFDLQLVRGSTAIAIGDAAGSRVRATWRLNQGGSGWNGSAAMVFLDSPATTSATTYKIQGKATSSGTVYINRSNTDSDSAGFVRTPSTITVLEISA